MLLTSKMFLDFLKGKGASLGVGRGRAVAMRAKVSFSIFSTTAMLLSCEIPWHVCVHFTVMRVIVPMEMCSARGQKPLLQIFSVLICLHQWLLSIGWHGNSLIRVLTELCSCVSCRLKLQAVEQLVEALYHPYGGNYPLTGVWLPLWISTVYVIKIWCKRLNLFP